MTGAMNAIPAAALLPPTGNAMPDHFWRPSDIEKGGSVRLYPTSAISSGWRYFTMNREIRLSAEYPDNYEAEIGYKFKHGPGKVDAEGRPTEEKAKPVGIWLMRAWHVEKEKMVAAIIDSFSLQTKLQKVYGTDGYLMLDSCIANFYLQVFHDAKPATPASTYDAIGALRVCQNPAVYEEAKKPWYPENYWLGLNPLTERADQLNQAPAAANPGMPTGLPATVRDENGADEIAELRVESEPAW